ncbi:hypothetical protein BJ138DRAFT_1075004 [Hygrophoropsis aurantiaca]|uniref:Uncharacterized protein n=1 Tax=Hygrophoropsis aurantiaca TaxID=72124 RepID=A0ACB8ASJ0_9AGAM|nr:hypothetical protein BJ138DRAFT_1075004 [Hygrophoropsis aurantiaca]
MTTSVVNAARTATTTSNTYRPYAHPQQHAQRIGPNITDDYERWYTEATASNRMVLALRSGIPLEIGWALDRLYRLCANEQFLLKTIPGLTEALFEWPEWYASNGYAEVEHFSLFSLPPEIDRKRRNAMESIFILRNSATNEPNATELANHRRTLPFIFAALSNLNFESDMHIEFVLNAIEILQAISSRVILPAPSSTPKSPLPALLQIIGHTSNRSLIMATLATLSSLFSNISNVPRLEPSSPALSASIRYLPLFMDKPLVDASLNYLYAHLSHPPMAKAFLHLPFMPSTLRVLVSLLLSEQVEEAVSVDITGTVHTIPAATAPTPDHDVTKEELEHLLPLPEPQRCYDWMKVMFVAKTDGELTQVDFWNLYKDVFSPHAERYPVLVASDVIKNVNVVFPQAQAMVLPGPPQRFVVRGVDRRKETLASQRFKCHWDRTQCSASQFESAGELYDHLLQHINGLVDQDVPCLWSSCPLSPIPKSHLRLHVLTHLSSNQPPARHPSQDDTVTLASESDIYPIADPTRRPPPPARQTSVSYHRPTVDPPSSSLTALLCIRILFRMSFASTDAAPRVDADHFGFPGVVEEDEGEDVEDYKGTLEGNEREGERKGRRAFIGVRRLMEGIRLKDETLMSWIVEMIDETGMAAMN